jgi:hypothetical protein
MAHAMERLFATPKTVPSFPASDDMFVKWLNRYTMNHRQHERVAEAYQA